MRDVEAMGEHYAATMARWIETFDSRYEEFVTRAGAEAARVWGLYLVGGGLAFE
ncbi:MAG: hypothetical protein NVSMB60_11540 [Mycobacterium sp.]